MEVGVLAVGDRRACEASKDSMGSRRILENCSWSELVHPLPF